MSAATPTRHIIVAVDTSLAALQAWRYTLDALYREGDQLHLLHVALTAPPQDTVLHSAPQTTFSVPGGAGEVDAQVMPKVERWLEDISQQAGSGIPVATHVFVEKESATAEHVRDIIVAAAQEQDAAMIVIAAHQEPLTLLQQLTKGSVAAALVASSPIPVLAVPGWPLE